jgi:hypothetical protein
MEYNEQTAKEIVEKYSLDEKTIKVWKTRNAIPDKYFKSDFVKKEKKVIVILENGKAHSVISERISEIFKNEDLKTITFSQLTGVDLLSVVKGNRRISEDEIIPIKKEINRLKSDILNLFSIRNTAKTIRFLNDERIKPYSVLKNLLQKGEVSKILYNKDLTNSEYEKVKDSFMILVLKLNI